MVSLYYWQNSLKLLKRTCSLGNDSAISTTSSANKSIQTCKDNIDTKSYFHYLPVAVNLSKMYPYTWSKKIENNSGLHGHPYLTPSRMHKLGNKEWISSLSLACRSLYINLITLTRSGDTPKLSTKVSHKRWRCTLS